MIMKKLLIVLVALIHASCSSMPQNPQKWMEWQGANNCLPTAIAFKEGLKASKCKWSKVVVYGYIDAVDSKPKGHAIVAFMYPIGKNQLWVYDSMGSYRTRAYINDPLTIAKLAETQRGRSKNVVHYAEFLE
jgi:hypothetical protein